MNRQRKSRSKNFFLFFVFFNLVKGFSRPVSALKHRCIINASVIDFESKQMASVTAKTTAPPINKHNTHTNISNHRNNTMMKIFSLVVMTVFNVIYIYGSILGHGGQKT